VKLKSFAVALCALSLSSTSGAFAANAIVVSDDLVAGAAAVARCDVTTNDWSVTFGPTGGATTTTVDVANIDDDCAGQFAELTVVGPGGIALDETSGTIPTCNSTCSIQFSVDVPTTSVAGIAMVVVG